MKKVYKKPYAYIETFEVSEHIAACEFDYENNTDPKNCYAIGQITGVDFFLFQNDDCNLDEVYCNNNGTAESVTFNS